jgi:hypothetical protein
MNKHLKPGVAVDVRGASDEVKEQVMAAFVGAGAIRTTDDRMTNFICWDSSIKRVYFFGGYSIGRHELISINQALGRESEVESKNAIVGQSNASNNWFERSELPPVGTVCEITHNGHKGYRRKVEILKYFLDTEGDPEDQRMIVVDWSGYVDFVIGNPYVVYGIAERDFKFIPLKTEKEKFVDRLVLIMNDNTNATFTEISGVLYDKGLRFAE